VHASGALARPTLRRRARVQVFYNLLIPPIVFYAGFSVKKKLFFKNLVTITIFGILGCNLTGAPQPALIVRIHSHLYVPTR
jgi:NhaP-type Na+/H+ or K+/H+ antiporter